MKIYKVVADKKPNTCIICPLMRLNQCGKDIKVQTTSSGTYTERVPDKRCLIRIKQGGLGMGAIEYMIKHCTEEELISRIEHLAMRKEETERDIQRLNGRLNELKGQTS